jgi:hypothetical protein
MLADRAYDSDAIRAFSLIAARSPSFPTSATGSGGSDSTKSPIGSAIASRMRFAASKTFAASQLVTTNWRETSSPQSVSPL